MAIKDLKISEAQVNQKGVVSAPDKLAGTAAENKAVFDRLVRDIVVPNFNNLLDDLSGLGGAGNIGAVVEGLAGSNVQALLANLKKHTDDTVTNIGAMSSFNGRNGAVVPEEGDYNADQITETGRQFVTPGEKAGWNRIAPHVEDEEAHLTGRERDEWNQITPHAADTSIHLNGNGTFLAAHPVGSIYFSASAVNPGDQFGGTWVAWGQGRVPLGVGSIQANTTTSYGSVTAGAVNRTTIEERGGEGTHVLTITEMPGHAHEQYVTANSGGSGIRKDYVGEQDGLMKYPQGIDTGYAGSGAAHNNIQPYITCYMWKRTA